MNDIHEANGIFMVAIPGGCSSVCPSHDRSVEAKGGIEEIEERGIAPK